jgi:hypothetical protein
MVTSGMQSITRSDSQRMLTVATGIQREGSM